MATEGFYFDAIVTVKKWLSVERLSNVHKVGCIVNYELLLRITLAGVMGAAIGLEREKRFKEAGLRTHFLVAVGSAVVMIISKYAFDDVIVKDGIRLDPARVAAQVVSGVGFLGAGMILVQRQAIHGLTTAAGIWATAGIGLAIGSGMYGVAIFATILVLIGLELLKRFFRFALPEKYHLKLEMNSKENISEVIAKLSEINIEVKQYDVKLKSNQSNQKVTIELYLDHPKNVKKNTITQHIQMLPGIVSIKWKT